MPTSIVKEQASSYGNGDNDGGSYGQNWKGLWRINCEADGFGCAHVAEGIIGVDCYVVQAVAQHCEGGVSSNGYIAFSIKAIACPINSSVDNEIYWNI